jgi:hypothetical protein
MNTPSKNGQAFPSISTQKPYANSPATVVDRTLRNTTQYGRTRPFLGNTIHDIYQSPFPALNVKRRQEAVATDTFKCDTPALGFGVIIAQFFVGRELQFMSVHPLKNMSQFVNTLEDEIRKRGAMGKLISDHVTNNISNKVLDILRHLCIEDWQSKPHYQHQNFAKRRYQTFKNNVTKVMDRSYAPVSLCFLCGKYFAVILNRTSIESLDWRTPFGALHGWDPDVSMIPIYTFFRPVYFNHYGPELYPSKSN